MRRASESQEREERSNKAIRAGAASNQSPTDPRVEILCIFYHFISRKRIRLLYLEFPHEIRGIHGSRFHKFRIGSSSNPSSDHPPSVRLGLFRIFEIILQHLSSPPAILPPSSEHFEAQMVEMGKCSVALSLSPSSPSRVCMFRCRVVSSVRR